MKTKSELEAEINDLKVRVAELEGMVAAYQYAFDHVKPGTPAVPYPPWTVWPDPHDGFSWTFNDPNVLPYTLPCITTFNFSE